MRCLERDARMRLRDIGEARVEIGKTIAGVADDATIDRSERRGGVEGADRRAEEAAARGGGCEPDAGRSAGCCLMSHPLNGELVVDRGARIPPGLQVGVDPEEDRRRFHVSDKGITLITPEMLGQQLHHLR